MADAFYRAIPADKLDGIREAVQKAREQYEAILEAENGEVAPR